MTDKERITCRIKEFVSEYRKTRDIRTEWGEPIVGFADANDPLYKELKNIIGPEHALPQEILPGAESVIVYFIPFTEALAKLNTDGDMSADAWDIAYIETNEMLSALSVYLHDKIVSEGNKASDIPISYKFDTEKLICSWSHRSSAYIAGLGTFGINNMLITDKGCCGRFGSIITDLKLAPDTRDEEERCLFKQNGSCHKCVDRCVGNAFAIDGNKVTFDRFKCNEHIEEKHSDIWPSGVGEACGKCMVGVPCSFARPKV